MLFNSPAFYIFFPTITVGYFLLPHKYRWGLLLAASCYFYMAFVPAYILVLGLVIIVDYFAAISIAAAQTTSRKRSLLLISLAANLGILFFFKYFNFANENIEALARLIGWNYSPILLGVILPIGLSFHTFQSMSYTIEVYKGLKPERHFGIYALYVMFYPQLVAGPIERPQYMLPQFHSEQRFDYQRIVAGLQLMGWGFFKKVVIADHIAPIVENCYNHPDQFSGIALTLATFLFAFQIFCDFSGYSDIAIGAAQVMGFNLTKNFKRPYFARSVSDFWNRWHISLSSWLRDYIFYPLRRWGLQKQLPAWTTVILPTMITMLVSGTWHGANWTFVIWGGLYGFYIIVERASQGMREKATSLLHLDKAPWLLHLIEIAATFLLVSFAWIFFRATSVGEAFHIIARIADGWLRLLVNHEIPPIDLGLPIYLIAAILGMELIHLIRERKGSLRAWVAAQPVFVRWPLYISMMLVILAFGKIYTTPDSFIYFQF